MKAGIHLLLLFTYQVACFVLFFEIFPKFIPQQYYSEEIQLLLAMLLMLWGLMYFIINATRGEYTPNFEGYIPDQGDIRPRGEPILSRGVWLAIAVMIVVTLLFIKYL